MYVGECVFCAVSKHHSKNHLVVLLSVQNPDPLRLAFTLCLIWILNTQSKQTETLQGMHT